MILSCFLSMWQFQSIDKGWRHTIMKEKLCFVAYLKEYSVNCLTYPFCPAFPYFLQFGPTCPRFLVDCLPKLCIIFQVSLKKSCSISFFILFILFGQKKMTIFLLAWAFFAASTSGHLEPNSKYFPFKIKRMKLLNFLPFMSWNPAVSLASRWNDVDLEQLPWKPKPHSC